MLVVLLEAVRDLVHRSSLADIVSPDVRAHVMRAHAGIEAALRERDPQAAARRTARHLASFRKVVATFAPAQEQVTPSTI